MSDCREEFNVFFDTLSPLQAAKMLRIHNVSSWAFLRIMPLHVPVTSNLACSNLMILNLPHSSGFVL
ncbi:hypothetical protein [Trichormus variabilis]|uniref:hypothetical protein n=1 Tax=Anabaena variabilis TaxID=264691 RepID=UPI000F8EA40B|nr:hypothetical protein [Trichormus variabilis]MBD2627439.1 hypothetical protein [Trichormus variabilis FACHB-164]